MPLNVTIQREDAEHTQSISSFLFPTTPDKLRQKLDQLGLAPENIGQFSITGIDYSHGEFTAEIENHFPESVSLLDSDKLNHLAALIDGLSNEDQIKLFTLFDYAANIDDFPYECDGLDDMIDLADNMERFIFILDADDIYDLADVLQYQRPLTAKASKKMAEGIFDSVEYAKEVMDGELGTFTLWGYMGWSGEYDPSFIDNGVPDAHRVWEQAIANMLPVKLNLGMADIDYVAINNGRSPIASLVTARKITGLAKGGQDPALYGGEKQKARAIIEMADLMESDPAFFPEWLYDCVTSKLGADVAALINQQLRSYEDGGIDAQIEYEVAPVMVGKHTDLLHKLLAGYPAELHGNDLFCALLVARELHRQKIEELSPMVDRSLLEGADEAQIKAFQLLPSDKQNIIEIDHETAGMHNRLVFSNSQNMERIYNNYIGPHIAPNLHPALPAPQKESILAKLKQAKEVADNRPQQPRQTDKKKSAQL